jgi:hypothetical protein
VLKFIIKLLQQVDMMFERFLPPEGAVFVIFSKNGLLGKASGCYFEVLGARGSVKVPVNDF